MPVQRDPVPHLGSPVDVGMDCLAHQGLEGGGTLLRHLVETHHMTVVTRQGGGDLGGKGLGRELHAAKLRFRRTL